MNDTDTERVAAIRERAAEVHRILGTPNADIEYLLTLVSQLQARAEEQGREVERLEGVVEAAVRLRTHEYLAWTKAGGPNECEHGYAKGIPCWRCDHELLRSQLVAPTAEQEAGGEDRI